MGGGGHIRFRGRAWGDPVPMKGQNLWYYIQVYYNPFTVNIELDMFISKILCEHQFYIFLTLQYFFTVHANCDMRTNLDDETYTYLHRSVIYLSILRCNFCENIQYM